MDPQEMRQHALVDLYPVGTVLVVTLFTVREIPFPNIRKTTILEGPEFIKNMERVILQVNACVFALAHKSEDGQVASVGVTGLVESYGRTRIPDWVISYRGGQRFHTLERGVLDGVLDEDGLPHQHYIKIKIFEDPSAVIPTTWSHGEPGTYWPSWVYRTVDPFCMAKKVAGLWERHMQSIKIPNGLPERPWSFSFFVASRLKLSLATQQKLLEIVGLAERLKTEERILDNFDHVLCGSCKAWIARVSSSFMHTPLRLKCCFKSTKGLEVVGVVKDRKGYAYMDAHCTTCKRLMGWKFEERNGLEKPFWLLKRDNLAYYNLFNL